MRLMMRSTEIAVTSTDHVENEVCRRHHHTEHQGRKRSDNGVRTKTAVRVALLSLCFCQGPRGTHVEKSAAETTASATQARRRLLINLHIATEAAQSDPGCQSGNGAANYRNLR